MTKEIKIQVPEGHEIDLKESNLALGVVKFKKIESKYPMNIEELDRNGYYLNPNGIIHYDNNLEFKRDLHSKHHLPKREQAEAIYALMQLIALRDKWNEIDGFVVDWSNINQVKFVITTDSFNIEPNYTYSFNRVLYFKTSETRNLFLETFRELIEKAKILL